MEENPLSEAATNLERPSLTRQEKENFGSPPPRSFSRTLKRTDSNGVFLSPHYKSWDTIKSLAPRNDTKMGRDTTICTATLVQRKPISATSDTGMLPDITQTSDTSSLLTDAFHILQKTGTRSLSDPLTQSSHPEHLLDSQTGNETSSNSCNIQESRDCGTLSPFQSPLRTLKRAKIASPFKAPRKIRDRSVFTSLDHRDVGRLSFSPIFSEDAQSTTPKTVNLNGKGTLENLSFSMMTRCPHCLHSLRVVTSTPWTGPLPEDNASPRPSFCGSSQDL